MQRKKEMEDQIVALKEELRTKEETLKKNTEDLRGQIQEGLRAKGLSQGAMMYDTIIEQMTLNIEEEQMRLDSGFALLHPVYLYQKSERWKEIQTIRTEKALTNMKDNLKEVETRVEEVKELIKEQNTRIVERRPKILEEIKELEAKNKSQSYIG